MTNKEFADKNDNFRAACLNTIIGTDYTGLPLRLFPTPRQASKYRNGKGLAYKTMMKMKGEN